MIYGKPGSYWITDDSLPMLHLILAVSKKSIFLRIIWLKIENQRISQMPSILWKNVRKRLTSEKFSAIMNIACWNRIPHKIPIWDVALLGVRKNGFTPTSTLSSSICKEKGRGASSFLVAWGGGGEGRASGDASSHLDSSCCARFITTWLFPWAGNCWGFPARLLWTLA